MIRSAYPLACGNAVQIVLDPPADAESWRVLRREDDAFTGPDDPDATPYDGQADIHALTDYIGLVNGTAYTYRVYYHDGAAWTVDGDDVEVTPGASYASDGPDPQDIVVERIDAGIQVEVARGALAPPAGRSAIDVLRAFALWQETGLPCVTVELVSTETAERALGETWGDDEEEEGWKRRWTLAICAWSLNPDERIALRQALERVLLANLPVFNAAGLYTVDCQWQDVFDDLQYDAPVYTAVGTFSCSAISRVTAAAPGAVVATVASAPACDVS